MASFITGYTVGGGFVVQSGDQLASLAGECNLLNVSAWHTTWSWDHQAVCRWIDFLFSC